MRKTITTVFFLLMIFGPAAGWLLGIRTRIDENRNPVRMPELSAGSILQGRFFSGLESFLNDRLPLRGPIIKVKNWIDYNIFNTSPLPEKIYLSKKGWIFYSPSLNDYLKNACDERARIFSFAKKLKRIEKRLEATGRRLYFVVAPNKATIYPEYIGLTPSENGCGRSRYEIFIEAQKTYPLHGFIRLDRMLKEAKAWRRLYWKTGTHWNIYGAMIASESLLKRMTTGWKGLIPEIEVSRARVVRDLSKMLGRFSGISEEGYMVKRIDTPIKVRHIKKRPLANKRPHLAYMASENGPGLLPRTIVYRDSFFTVPLKIIKGAFSGIDALWSHRVPTKEGAELEELPRARIIIIEVVERDLLHVYVDEERLFEALEPGRKAEGTTIEARAHSRTTPSRQAKSADKRTRDPSLSLAVQ